MNFMISIMAIGAIVLNVRKKRASFLIWIATNSYWCGHNFKIGEYSQAGLFAVFAIFSIWGFYLWGREARKNGRLYED